MVRDRAVYNKDARRKWDSVRDTRVRDTSTINTVQYRREFRENTVGVAVYFMDSSDECFAQYTIPPILSDIPVGKELQDIVPFQNWGKLKVRQEIGGIADGWVEVYDVEQKLNVATVMRLLNEIQKKIFADKKNDIRSRLVFCLKTKEGFQIPQNISENGLYQRIEPGEPSPFLQSSAALLDKLKMLTDEL